MKRLAMVLMSGALAAASLRCAAQPACTQVVVPASVEAGQGELTLADLVGRGSCPEVREAAAQVSLGTAPRAGSVRVFDGREVRRQLEELASAGLSAGKPRSMQVPERIVVKRAGATKSCAEIARFVASTAAQEGVSVGRRWREDVNCAAAGDIPEEAALEVTKTTWNAALRRWEFALRCSRSGDCVPFLVWTHDGGPNLSRVANGRGDGREGPKASAVGTERLVGPGQTATLTWEQGGIRVVLPVTCLDAGGAGQFVRVRFKNGTRILRAEVVGKAMLRASL
jgi:hypothetical protein